MSIQNRGLDPLSLLLDGKIDTLAYVNKLMEVLDMKELEEDFIIKHWEEDFEEGTYFKHLSNGDSLGYIYDREEFSLNNYWNAIDKDEAVKLVKEFGLDE